MQTNNKDIDKFMEILKDIAKLSGQDIGEVIKEAFKKAGLKMPNYEYFEINSDFKDIKKGDTVVFNLDYAELENGKKYLLEIGFGTKITYICGEYNKDFNFFIYGNNPDDYIDNNDEIITVLGQMVGIQK